MLQPKLSSAIKSNSKATLNFSQVQSKTLLDVDNFFDRVCEALGVPNERGAKATVAKKLDLAKTSVGLWANGEMPGRNSLDSLVKISELGNVSLHWLLTGEGEKLITPLEKDINIEDFLRNKIRQIVYEENKRFLFRNEDKSNKKAVLGVQELGDIDEFSVEDAVEKYPTLEATLEAWYQAEGKSLPSDFALNFGGWENLSLEDRIQTVRDVKKFADEMNAKIDKGEIDYD